MRCSDRKVEQTETFPSYAHQFCWILYKHSIMSFSRNRNNECIKFFSWRCLSMTCWKYNRSWEETKRMKTKVFLLPCTSLGNLRHTDCDRCMNLRIWYHLLNFKSNINRKYRLRLSLAERNFVYLLGRYWKFMACKL